MPGGKPFQSKLNPYLDLIRGLRKKRVAYPEIARILREEHGLEVGPTTIFDFVKVRSKKRDVIAIPDDQPGASAPAHEPTSPATPPTAPEPPKPQPRPTTRPAHETRSAKVSAAKQAAAERQAAAQKPGSSDPAGWADFADSFDPAKPLKLNRPTNQDSNAS